MLTMLHVTYYLLASEYLLQVCGSETLSIELQSSLTLTGRIMSMRVLNNRYDYLHILHTTSYISQQF